jgi:hypothetical protein
VNIGVLAFIDSANSVQLAVMMQKDYETRLNELESQNVEYAYEIAKRDDKIHGLQARIHEIEAQLNHEMGVTAALKQLYRGLDDKIMRTLNERGQRKKKTSSHHPAIAPARHTDYEALICIAREYDVNEFFTLKARTPKHNLRFSYRMVAKGYRVMRDGGMTGAKKLYHLKAGRK